VPADVSPPHDLVALEIGRRRAYRELLAFSDSTAAQRLRDFPGPEQWFERQQWPPELGARLEELRDAERDAALAVHRHPAIAQALAEHRYRQLREALQSAADLREADAAPEGGPK
jgi:hypothetical protein